jgi:UDP-2,3-diacylglucosamine pyrophosphatase LpxH
MARRDVQGHREPNGDKSGRRREADGNRPPAVENGRSRLAERLIAADPTILGPPQITTTTDGDTKTIQSASHGIRTVDDLLRHIEADLTKFEVVASEATVWESPSDGAKVPLYRVWVKLRPRGGPGVLDAVKAMLDGAAASITRKARKPHRPRTGGAWQVLVVADVHLAKLAWTPSTGEADYDLDIATRLLRDTSHELVASGDAIFKPSRRTVAFLGDLFHFDTPHGTTSSGNTYLDRDSRIQKMLDVGTDALLDVVARSAETCQTDVVLVAGNHDEALSWAFHKMLSIQFAKDERVTIAKSYTARTYAHHGGTLLGFAHGNRAKKKLPQLMAYERPALWAQCPYREYHTGHFHSQAAEWQRPIETIDSVVVRTAPALCPADEWHSANGFLGSRRAMETFFYSHRGGLDGMLVAGPEEEGK